MTEIRPPLATQRLLRDLITVTLVCGDQVKARNSPRHARTTYPCPANKGHGYQVGWKEYVHHSADYYAANPLYADSEEGSSCGE